MAETSQDSPESSAEFEGYIDFIADDGRLFGWVRSLKEPDRSVEIDVFVNGGSFGRFRADRFRRDLLDAGKGSGCHGFEVDLGHLLNGRGESGPLAQIEVYTASPSIWKIGSVVESSRSAIDELRTNSQKREQLRQLLIGFVSIASVPQDFSTRRKDETPQRAPSYNKLFSCRSLSSIGSSAINEVSSYLDFTRFRLRLDQEFRLEFGTPELDAYLKRYIEYYCAQRAHLRAPLSARELRYLNEPIAIGGKKHHLSRATMLFLPDEPHGSGRLNMDSDDGFVEAVYWWSVERAPQLFVEDCLVPEYYRLALLTVAPQWHGAPFPPSRFMEIYFSRNSQWHFLNLHSVSDRQLWYSVLLIQGLRTPLLLRFVPSYWIRELLKVDDGGSNFLQRLGEAIFGFMPACLEAKQYKVLLEEAGFALHSMKVRTISSAGHRVLSPALEASISDEPPADVQVIGPLRKASGLGQASRLSAEILSHTDWSVSYYGFDLDNPAPVDALRTPPPRRHGSGLARGFERAENIRRARINLIHLNAESVPLAFAYLPDVFTDAYNIGYFFWELNTPAKCHFLGLELLDEVWVSSEYGADVYRPNCRIPVSNVGMTFEEHGADRSEARSFLRERFGIANDEFVFFSAFDSFSFVQRKNPLGVIRAFIDAFRHDERVRLLVKTQNRDFVGDPVQQKIWRAVLWIAERDSRITVVNETLPYGELMAVKAGCDCYVSLHRSEGWGFGLIEAMNLGIPVVATGYSGNMEFCSESTAWLVDYDLVPLGPDDYIFVTPGQVWAEPRHGSAVNQLKRVYSDEVTREARAKSAKRDVQSRFSSAAIAERYSKRIGEILSGVADGER